MKFKFFSLVSVALAVSFLLAPLASAHVVVTPSTAVAGDEVTFSMSVPNEKQIAVTSMKLTLPAGLDEVAPTVHSGWTIQTTVEHDKVTAIMWSGGQIPAGQRDDFSFQAQVPAKVSSLQWKAYQTYADGSTVAWDQTPTSSEQESDTAGPYSVTAVSATEPAATTTTSSAAVLALGASLLAVVLSVFAVLRSGQRK